MTLDLPQPWLQELTALCHQWAPQFDVWAYGSRVTGNYHDASDLDLVLIHPTQPATRCQHWFELREALVESNIPISVDVMDWASVPPEFYEQINQHKVKLLAATTDQHGEG